MNRLLRGVAYAVAIAAVIDPAIERDAQEPVRVGVHVVTSGRSPEAELALAQLDERLGADAVIVRGLAGGAAPWCVDVDLCVVLSDETRPIAGRPARAVTAVRLPSAAPMRVVAARASIGHAVERAHAVVAMTGGREGETVDIVVEDRGVEVGRVAHTRSGRAIDRAIAVPWWPRGVGARTATIRLESAGTVTEPAVAMLVDTASAPAEVLVWEARPSWTGTFVRRSLQDDPRLAVRAASQIAPGRAVSRGVTGRPDDAALRRALAVVVTGANALDTGSVGRLEAFARGGGAVVVALDDDPVGPVQALMPGPPAFRRRSLDPVLVGGQMRSAELVTFAGSASAVPMLRWPDETDGPAVVVERPLGRGHVVVSGALDAWRWRDEGQGFDRFWQDVAVRAARSAVPALGLSWVVGAKGSELQVVSREGVIAGSWPPLRVSAVCHGVTTPLVPEETASAGTWTTSVPHATDGCVIDASTASAAASISWPGVATVPTMVPDADALDRLAAVSGGDVVPIEALVDRVDGLVAQSERPLVLSSWHPMRAWWWFVPFTAALGVEWWRRRRQGTA